VQPRVLKGFRDFLPGEQVRREAMLGTIARTFRSFGFAPLSTPSVEYLDVLTGKCGDEGDKLLYHFKDHGGRDVALRYDLTVPLARVVAQHRELHLPFKRYQIGTVWRAEKPARGRFREFTQCDADIVGAESPLADADCIASGIHALRALGIEQFRVRLSHRGVLNALLAASGIDEPGVQVIALRVLDKLDKVGVDAVLEMLSAVDGVDVAAAKALMDRVKTFIGRGGEVISALEQAFPGGEQDDIRHLKDVWHALDVMGLSSYVRVDLSIARGLDYYTGTVFETALDDFPAVGSVMSGGRYDGLLDMFGAADVPAVGISIGVDRLFSALGESLKQAGVRAGPSVVACPIGIEALDTCLRAVVALRSAGVSSEPVPDPSWRMKKQLKYAVKREARFAMIVGEEELAANEVTVRDLDAGSQTSLGADEAARHVQDRLKQGVTSGD